MRDWAQSLAAIRAANRPTPPSPRFLQAPRIARLPQAPMAARLPQVPMAARLPQPAMARTLQTPAVVINEQYDAFRDDIAGAIDQYLGSFAVESSQTIQLTLVDSYEPGSGLFSVPSGTSLPPASEEAPLEVAARPPGEAPRLYQITGTASGLLTGVQAFNPVSGGFGSLITENGIIPAPDAPLPAGSTLEIVLISPSPDFENVSNQYLNYVADRTQRLSQDLVTYFNRLPIRLPRIPGAYHTPRPETAIQFLVANQIAGQGPQQLLEQLTTQPLPVGSEAAVELYLATIDTIIGNSREQILEGVRLLFAGRSVLGTGQISPVIPVQP